MKKLIWMQYKYSWKLWANCFSLFLIMSILVSVCFIGFFSLLFSDTHVLLGANDPTPIFIMPVTFGGLTLLVVMGNMLRFILAFFRKDYRTWLVLGANPRQLASLVGGQLSIFGALSGGFGYFLAYPLTVFFYRWLQLIVGKEMLPAISIKMSLFSFFCSIFLVTLLWGAGGYFKAKKMMKNDAQEPLIFGAEDRKALEIRWWLYGISILIIAFCYWQLLKDSFSLSMWPLLLSGLIIFVNSVTSQLVPFLLNKGRRFLPKNKNGSFITAFWSVVSENEFAKALFPSVLIGTLLVSGFSSLITNILTPYSQRSAGQQATENLLIYLLYLGAPLLIICGHILVITQLHVKKKTNQFSFFSRIGFTFGQLFMEEMVESIIYVGVYLVYSFIGCFFLTFPIFKLSTTIFSDEVFSWVPTFFLPVCFGFGIFLFLFLNFIGRLLLERMKQRKLVS
ncbi:hypothetical protein RV11_GL000861 [Enterococcus phoeniculicola]|jgi:hypothetical protein|uniref:ABC3 transporter permease protein domain-containing protein n=1 Tax=Enterococcus phoeniculicola ATCC BAA-412 TaxID=1158610 RepID=R3WM43_9ENTE|nr:hypothetical protein [Enterococcus phoeniculicola]EOL48906.1 hypothetical protein UC3_00458 [Enterococcus phoeniculicola ATCC BAA-412]EOT72752.1 hypothetical protein I589_03022 [Enterococcus phoeniculicola ATCC BAA-412]OJG70799.1 hypothetical protein RV11_GL000861 [Enterococcus phoeniculicola]